MRLSVKQAAAEVTAMCWQSWRACLCTVGKCNLRVIVLAPKLTFWITGFVQNYSGIYMAQPSKLSSIFSADKLNFFFSIFASYKPQKMAFVRRYIHLASTFPSSFFFFFSSPWQAHAGVLSSSPGSSSSSGLCVKHNGFRSGDWLAWWRGRGGGWGGGWGLRSQASPRYWAHTGV